MVEGLLLGGTGLGVLALIFEIAADAFSVAAYQTLLAIHGAGAYQSHSRPSRLPEYWRKSIIFATEVREL